MGLKIDCRLVTGPRLFFITALALLLLAAPAYATYPGANGKIAFVSHFGPDTSLNTINPDGTNEAVLIPPTMAALSSKRQAGPPTD